MEGTDILQCETWSVINSGTEKLQFEHAQILHNFGLRVKKRF